MNKDVTNRRYITYRQLRAVDLWFRNGRKSKARALREAGYSEAVVRQPHKVFDSPAVRRELEQRGHGFSGILDNQQPIVEEVQEKPKAQVFDVSMITEEQLQTLREQLDTIPDPPEQPKYQPTFSGMSYTQKSTTQRNTLDPFSSM